MNNGSLTTIEQPKGEKMPTKIDPNFKPSDRVYELLVPLLGSIERAREFCGQELGEFIMYWEGISGKAAAKSNWNSTFHNRMKRVYEYKKEAMARNRSFGGQQENIFQEIAGGMIAEGQTPPGKKPRRQVRIQSAPIPGEGETMNQADALAQLAKMTGRT
jgi:hypothetical protein